MRLELGISPPRGTLAHRGDEDDEDPEVDLPSEEPDRWWGGTHPATVGVTRKTETKRDLGVGTLRSTPRLPWVVGLVETTAAGATLRPKRFGEVAVDAQKQDEKPWVREKGMAQWRHSLPLWKVARSYPPQGPTSTVALSEGEFFSPSRSVLRPGQFALRNSAQAQETKEGLLQIRALERRFGVTLDVLAPVVVVNGKLA